MNTFRYRIMYYAQSTMAMNFSMWFNSDLFILRRFHCQIYFSVELSLNDGGKYTYLLLTSYVQLQDGNLGDTLPTLSLHCFRKLNIQVDITVANEL